MPDEQIQKHGLWRLYLTAVVAMVCALVVGHLVTGRSLVAVMIAYTILAAAVILVYSLRSESASGTTLGREVALAFVPMLGLTFKMPFGPDLGWVAASAMILGTSYGLGRRIRKARTRI